MLVQVFESRRVYLDITSRTKNGEKSLPFVMTDFKGNQIDSDELIGKILIIQFHLGFDSPMHNDNHLKAYDKLISNITHHTSIVALVVTRSNTDQVSNFENRTQYSTPIIPNGANFMKRYKISSYPSFMLVDQNGILVKYLDDWNLDEVKNELLKL